MGLWTWFKSLLSGKRVCCDVCREEIRASDFVKGRAVVVARKRFCRHCVEFVTKHRQPVQLRRPLEMSSSATPLMG